jgi:hypothetical protein
VTTIETEVIVCYVLTFTQRDHKLAFPLRPNNTQHQSKRSRECIYFDQHREYYARRQRYSTTMKYIFHFILQSTIKNY